MERRFTLEWDVAELAQAFRVKEQDVIDYFTDGRRVSFIIERRLKWDNPDWTLAPSEGAGYDLLDPNGGKWEVRSLTKGGVYFNPSNQVGAGRRFNEDGFRQKLDDIEGFIISDIELFPRVEVYVVPFENVVRWYELGRLGMNAKVTRKKFHQSLANDIQFS